jgi:hypothetical protein
MCACWSRAADALPHVASVRVQESESMEQEMPLGGDNVMVPADEQVAEYFYQRKLLTVNGMHTTLAFMTLCEDFDAKKELTRELMEGVRVPAGPIACKPAVS